MPDAPPAVDPATEGDGDTDDHAVPADLTVLHEVIEFEQAAGRGPNEEGS